MWCLFRFRRCFLESLSFLLFLNILLKSEESEFHPSFVLVSPWGVGNAKRPVFLQVLSFTLVSSWGRFWVKLWIVLLFIFITCVRLYFIVFKYFNGFL